MKNSTVAPVLNAADTQQALTTRKLKPKPKAPPAATGGFRSFYEFDSNPDPALNEVNWHSILIVEDLIVAALSKSLVRSGESVSTAAAYQALRDAIGEMISQEPTLKGALEELLARRPGGSGDREPMQPPPNP